MANKINKLTSKSESASEFWQMFCRSTRAAMEFLQPVNLRNDARHGTLPDTPTSLLVCPLVFQRPSFQLYLNAIWSGYSTKVHSETTQKTPVQNLDPNRSVLNLIFNNIQTHLLLISILWWAFLHLFHSDFHCIQRRWSPEETEQVWRKFPTWRAAALGCRRHVNSRCRIPEDRVMG